MSFKLYSHSELSQLADDILAMRAVTDRHFGPECFLPILLMSSTQKEKFLSIIQPDKNKPPGMVWTSVSENFWKNLSKGKRKPSFTSMNILSQVQWPEFQSILQPKVKEIQDEQKQSQPSSEFPPQASLSETIRTILHDAGSRDSAHSRIVETQTEPKLKVDNSKAE